MKRRDIMKMGVGAWLSSLGLVGCRSGEDVYAMDQRSPFEPMPVPPVPYEEVELPGRVSEVVDYGVDVLSRGRWAQRGPVVNMADAMDGVNRLTVHHDSILAPGLSERAAAARMESIRRFHQEDRGWADIGYHFAIDPAGRVWEARPLSLQGAHVRDHNEHNIGVMVMGDFNQQRPTRAQLTTLETLLTGLMQAGRIPRAAVHTHQELGPTSCPGVHLQRYMNQIRQDGTL